MSARNRSEFLAVPELVRFSTTLVGQGVEGCLLIKTSTLTLKYLATLRHFSITFASAAGSLGTEFKFLTTLRRLARYGHSLDLQMNSMH